LRGVFFAMPRCEATRGREPGVSPQRQASTTRCPLSEVIKRPFLCQRGGTRRRSRRSSSGDRFEIPTGPDFGPGRTVAIMRSKQRSASSLVAPTLSEIQMMQGGRSKITDTTSVASAGSSTRLGEPVNHCLCPAVFAAANLDGHERRAAEAPKDIVYLQRRKFALESDAVAAQLCLGYDRRDERAVGIVAQGVQILGQREARSNSHAAKQRTWTWNLSSPGLSPSRANSISNSN
jgi:hypothetical protein